MKITVSAPGKIHLIGEHAVVYGYPAILASINRRMTVTLTLDRVGKDKVTLNYKQGTAIVEKSIEVFKKAAGITTFPHLVFDIDSQIPVGCGLGSSAALSVCVIATLLKTFKNIWNPIRVNELAYEVEKFQHTNPSGGDNTVVTFGGLLWYRKETEFLKSIWNLPVSSYHIPKMILIDSGRPKETTGEMVEFVGHEYKKNTEMLSKIFKSQEELTRDFLRALKTNNTKTLEKCIFDAEQNLEKIGVVSQVSQHIIREIEKRGGVAKISGAGGRGLGSGMILCFHNDIEKLISFAKEKNLPWFEVILGKEGLRIEEMEGIKKTHD